MNQPQRELLQRAQAGDEQAFTVLVRVYQAPVFTFVLRALGGDRELAEDLTQDVFLRVFQGLAGFSERSSFTTWLYQVARNRVTDELRLRSRRGTSVQYELASAEARSGSAEELDKLASVWSAIARLSPDLRAALLLRDVVGLSYLEIAEVLQITLSTVKWRIYRSREEVIRMTGGLEAPIAAPPARPLPRTV